jgi:cysteine-rich repeat protein
MRDNIAWAMDPKTSCEAPGCTNPYGGAPLKWTFKDSDKDKKPAFVRRTRSYMPICHQTANSTSCAGDTPTTFTGQGLEFARKTVNDYRKHSAPFKSDDHTRYVNVLLTDGQTSDGSSDVQAVLRQMVSEGVDTFVIGFGTGDEIDRVQLDRYAEWGNTQHAIVVDPTQPTGAAELADALAGVVKSLGIDACCVLNACASEPEPADPHAVCGDGQVDGAEVCDDGKANATYGHCGGDCRGPHVHCGDMRIDAPQEMCDDGNTRGRDGCDEHCQIEEDFDAGVSGPPSGAGGGPAKVTTEVVTAPPTMRTPGAATSTNAQAVAGGHAGVAGGTSAETTRHGGCGCRLQAGRGDTLRGVAWFGLGVALVGRVRRRRRAE